jgi:hypothetical protein
MFRLRVLLSAVAAIAITVATTPGMSNDSSAELATGGLVFTKNAIVEMRSEDLYLSAKEIRARYHFINKSDREVTTTVAFPMPDIALDDPDDNNFEIPTDDPQNILGFTTMVNGRPVTAQVEQKIVARVQKTTYHWQQAFPARQELGSKLINPRNRWAPVVFVFRGFGTEAKRTSRINELRFYESGP